MADEDVSLDLLTGAVVNSAGNDKVARLAAVSSGGKGRLGDHRRAAKVARGLERQLPRELAQRGVFAADAEGHAAVHVGGGDELGEAGLYRVF